MNENKLAITIIQDEQTAFPLLEIDNLDFAVSCLPITLMQLEIFLADINDPHYNTSWYLDEILKEKPRVSPHNIERSNIAGVLVSNIELSEIHRVSDWFGNGINYDYSLPTRDQWQSIANLCRKHSRFELKALPDRVDPRSRSIMQRLQTIMPASNLAEQMLLGTGGIEEYIYVDDARQTCEFVNSQGLITPFTEVLANDGVRRKKLTFRLIRRMR